MHYLIEDFVQNWEVKRKRYKTDQTMKSYQKVLEQFFTYVEQDGGDVTQLLERDVFRYFEDLETRKIEKKTKNGIKTVNVSVSTFQKHFTIVYAYLKYHGKDEYMNKIEYPQTDNTKAIAPKSLSVVQINKIKREIEKKNRNKNGEWKKGGKMQVALIYVLMYTGIRIFELVGLDRTEHIELSERKGTLKFVGKGQKYREVPIPVEARNMLIDYLEERTDDNPALFVSNRGERIKVRNIQDIIQRLGETCGFDEPLHPHIFRHTWCYNAVKTLPLSTVAHLAGHTDPKTTMIYTKPNMEDASNALDKMFDN